MACLKEIPVLMGDNYAEWRKKIDFAFVCNDLEWVISAPQPIEPPKLVRAENESDADWQKRERDYAPLELAYTLSNRQWTTANKKCMALVKNTIEPAFLGSIEECVSTGEYLDKIKSQFTGSSKTYGTQLLKKLVNEKYNGGAIRDHILRMSNMNAKLKPFELDFSGRHMIHLVFASLPKEFENFVINYNMQPE
ncbi:unnamed protein product [Urochloa humidicola]